MKHIISRLCLALLALSAITNSASAEENGYWDGSIGVEKSFDGKIGFKRPGFFDSNIPQVFSPSGVQVLDTAVVTRPPVGAIGAEEKDAGLSLAGWGSRMWYLDTPKKWSAGISLGLNWRPLSADASFDGFTDKQVLHLSPDCGCAQVSDGQNKIGMSFDGNMISAYVGPKVQFRTPLNKKETVFFTAFADAGASLNWLWGNTDTTETYQISRNSTALTTFATHHESDSDSDFNVGAYGRLGVGVSGVKWSASVYGKYDYRDTLSLHTIDAKMSGASVGFVVSRKF